MVWEQIGAAAAAIGLPVLRSAGGWLHKSLEDRKVTKFELEELLKTVLRTAVLGTLVYVGADQFGFDVDLVASSATAILLDLILGALKENKNVTKR